MFHEWDIGVHPEEWQTSNINGLNHLLLRDHPAKILRWTVDWLAPQLAFPCEFSRSDVVLLHMLSQIPKRPKIFFIDTGRLPQETYELIDSIRRQLKINIQIFYPDSTKLEEMTNRDGYDSMVKSQENRLNCCQVRRVEPVLKAMKDHHSWLSGKTNHPGNKQEPRVLEIDDPKQGILRINPLISWSEDQVSEYIVSNHLPTHSYYGLGYKNIGCAPCTRPIVPERNITDGKWWWESGLVEDKRVSSHS